MTTAPIETEVAVATYQHVLVEHSNRIAYVTMNRPARRNALSLEHMQELIASVCAREPNPEVEQRLAAREVDCRTRLKAHFAAASRRHK